MSMPNNYKTSILIAVLFQLSSFSAFASEDSQFQLINQLVRGSINYDIATDTDSIEDSKAIEALDKIYGDGNGDFNFADYLEYSYGSEVLESKHILSIFNSDSSCPSIGRNAALMDVKTSLGSHENGTKFHSQKVVDTKTQQLVAIKLIPIITYEVELADNQTSDLRTVKCSAPLLVEESYPELFKEVFSVNSSEEALFFKVSEDNTTELIGTSDQLFSIFIYDIYLPQQEAQEEEALTRALIAQSI